MDTVVCKAEINPEDRRRVADWYLTGQESIPQNSYKSLKLFESIMDLDFYKDNKDVIEDINKNILEATRLIIAGNAN